MFAPRLVKKNKLPLAFGYVIDASCKTSITMKFYFLHFVVSVLLPSALSISPKYPSVVFTLELLDNPFFSDANCF